MKIENRCIIQTHVGALLAAEQNGELTKLLFLEQDCNVPACSEAEIPIFLALRNWLDDYFSGNDPSEKIALRPQGTAFQLEIWDMLLSIPHSKVVSYGELANEYTRRHGGKMSAQAVGGAVGRNPISIIIPCHRVVGANGCLTGYAGGLDRKLRLLETEGTDTSKMFFPISDTGRAKR